jgi:hypothetical protein
MLMCGGCVVAVSGPRSAICHGVAGMPWSPECRLLESDDILLNAQLREHNASHSRKGAQWLAVK